MDRRAWRASVHGIVESDTTEATEQVYINNISDSMDVNLSELRKLVMDREACHTAIHGVAKSRTRLSD